METPENFNYIDVGIVHGAYGVKGFIRVESLSDVPERFEIGSEVFLGNLLSVVENFFWQKDSLILKLDSINDRDEALSYKGTTLRIGLEQVGFLPDGQYFHFQILGMDVKSENGDPLGGISEILTTGTNDVYIVKGLNPKELLIPAIPEVVLSVDVDSNLMTVRLLDGLIN